MIKGKYIIVLAGVAAMVFTSRPVSATQDLVGSRSLGMGGALRAAPTGETAVLLNPAGMSLNRAYVVNALYQYRVSDSASMVNTAVVDSVTKLLAAGLYYSYSHATPKRTLFNLPSGGTLDWEQTFNIHEIGLALGYPLFNMLHIGVSGKYINIGVEQPEETPDELINEGGNKFTMDIGAILSPIQGLNLAVVYSNAVPMDDEHYPRLLGMGVSYAVGPRFLAEFDVELDFDRGEKMTASYHAGAELFLGRAFAIRGGYMYDDYRKASYATGGLGLVTPKLSLDFGLRQMASGGAETMLAFSVRLFLQ